MIIIIGSNKGGSGKTTTAINLAVSLVFKDKDVCLVDADPQRSSSKWYEIREERKLNEKLTLIEKLGNISETLKKLDDKYEYVLVDVAGRNSRELITGCVVADILIAPHQCSQQDLDTMIELEEQIRQIRDLNPNLKVYCYHAISTTNPLIQFQERNDFLSFTSEINGIKVLDSISHYRKIYRDTYSEGKSVLESDNEKAINEINDLTKEVLEL